MTSTMRKKAKKASKASKKSPTSIERDKTRKAMQSIKKTLDDIYDDLDAIRIAQRAMARVLGPVIYDLRGGDVIRKIGDRDKAVLDPLIRDQDTLDIDPDEDEACNG